LSTAGEKMMKRLPNGILIVVSFLIVIFTFFIVVWRILLWEILNPLIYANIFRLMALFGLPKTEFEIGWTSIVRIMSQLVIIVVLIYLGVKNRYFRSKEFWLMSIPLLGILIISSSSLFWSLIVPSTVKRLWFFLAATMGGIFIGLEFKRSRIICFFESFSVLVVLLSYVMVIVYPSHGIMTFDAPGAWRGVFDYKSFAGQIIAFAGIMFLFRFSNFKNERWPIRVYSVIFLLLSIFFLVKTQNKTAMGIFLIVAAGLVLGLIFIKWGGLLKQIHWWLFGGMCVAALLALWLGKDALLGLVGLDTSLTGRVPMWAALMPFIRQRLLLGYGFGEVFWYTQYLEEFWKVAPWKAGLAHSGYIEAILDTGVIGFIFWIAFLIEVGYFSLRYFLIERGLYALIFLAWFVQVILNNVTENLLGTYESFYFLLLVISFAFIFRVMSDRRSQLSDLSEHT
jgi:exopolysaccharide production protein ExoQ